MSADYATKRAAFIVTYGTALFAAFDAAFWTALDAAHCSTL